MYRINIAAYVTNEETSAAIKTAMGEISLVRSSAEIIEGGLQAALARYSSDEGTPELLVVQSDAEETVLREQLQELSGFVSPGTQVVVVGQVDSIDFYRWVIDLGVGQYLLSPLTSLGMLRAVKDVYGGERETTRGRTIAVVGSKGGIGASTVSHNLAWSLANIYDKPVSLIDLDLHFGTAGIDYNHENRYGLRDALTQAAALGSIDESLLERLFSKESDKLWLLASTPSMTDSTSLLNSDTLESVLDGVARMSDFVVIDVPHIWNPAIGGTLLMADEVVIVAEPSLQGLRNTQLMFEAISPNKPQGTYLRYVLNNCGLDRASEIGPKEFSEALGNMPVLSMPWAPAVYRNAGIQGRMMVDSKKNSKGAQIYNELARAISGGAEAADPRARKKNTGSSLLSRLRRGAKSKGNSA